MKRRHLLLVALAMTSLALPGCATVGQAQHCAGWQPIYPDVDDVLTDDTAKQILAHDKYGVTSGCWPAPTNDGDTHE